VSRRQSYFETTPKGFNATVSTKRAATERARKHQEHDLTPLIERHHLLSMLSEGKERSRRPFPGVDRCADSEGTAETNLHQAQTGVQLVQSGAIQAEDERTRVSKDPDSGYFEMGVDDDDPLSDFGLSDEAIAAAHELGSVKRGGALISRPPSPTSTRKLSLRWSRRCAKRRSANCGRCSTIRVTRWTPSTEILPRVHGSIINHLKRKYSKYCQPACARGDEPMIRQTIKHSNRHGKSEA